MLKSGDLAVWPGGGGCLLLDFDYIYNILAFNLKFIIKSLYALILYMRPIR